MSNLLKPLFLLFVIVTSIGAIAQNPYCDLSKQWVEFEPEFPKDNSFVRLTEIYKNELYVFAKKDTSRYVWNIYKLDTVDGWEFITDIATNCEVYGFTVYKDEVYVAGACNGTGGDGMGYVVRYDGEKWNPTRLDSAAAYVGVITDFETYKGDLYATGTIGAPFNGIAKFDGVKWDSLRNGLEGSEFPYMNGRCLAVFNETLYVGGYFEMTQQADNQNLASWDGVAWHDVPKVDSRISEMHATKSKLVVWAPGARFGNLSIENLSFLKEGVWHDMGLVEGDFISAAEFADIDDEIYMHTWSSTLGGNNIDQGVVYFRNNKWERTSQFESYGHNELTAYRGRLIVSLPRSSCGTAIEGLGVLCDLNTCSSVSGQVFVDDNRDCAKDNEIGVPYPKILIDEEEYAVGDVQGNWRAFLPVGNYTVSYNSPKYFESSCVSPEVEISVASSMIGFGQAGDVNFPISAIAPYKDLEVSITAGRARVGFDAWVQVLVKNVGTVSISGKLITTLDDNQIYQSNNANMNKNGRELSWDFGELKSFEFKKAIIRYKVPANVDLLGEKILTTTSGNFIGIDVDTTNNKDTAEIEITGAYDPNEKVVFPKGADLDAIQGAVLAKETNEFIYTIHFQNTGNDTAFKVVLKDTLDQNLDISTLEIIDASHPMQLLYDDGRYIHFVFENILLPDSTTDLLGSQGFAKFKISTNKDLPVGTVIKNRASIYFDYNPAIHTNEVINTLVTKSVLAVNSPPLNHFIYYPNPTTGWLHIKPNGPHQLNEGNVYIEIIDMFGRVVLRKELSNHESKIDLNGLSSGVYLVQLSSGKQRYKSLKIRLLNEQ
ncbi:MAG: T9SS type A sorting domain-containing protein [Bacteroidia bacterium]